MALIRPGSLAGQVSGSLGNTVFSHNRYGAYIRKRTKPTLVTNANTLAARGRLVAASQNWGTLDEATKRAWASWAQGNPITNRLGDRHTLTGHAAYVQLNSRIQLAGGALLELPPTAIAPPSLDTLALEADIGVGDFEATFTPTPLATGLAAYIQAAVLEQPGQAYYKNKLKLVYVGAGATASPVALQSAIEDRFGALQVGHRVVLLGSVLDTATGLLSGARTVEAEVVSTT